MLPILVAIVGSLSSTDIVLRPAVASPPSIRAAARPQGEALTVEQAVRLTLVRHPRLLGALHDVRAAQLGLAAASAFASPEISVTPGFTRSGSDEELLIRQPLEINGARAARAALAGARLRAVQAEAILELHNLVLETKTAFFGLARAQERRALADDLLESAEEFDRIAQRQVELEVRPGIERTQTTIEVVRARQQLTLAEADRSVAAAELNILLGRDPGEPLAVVLPEHLREPAVEADAVQRALTQRAELAVVEANRDAFRGEARLARAQALPDLAPQYRLASLTREPREGGFGIAISIPIFDSGNLRSRARQGDESARAEEQRLRAVEARVRQEVSQAIARMRAAEEVVDDFEGGLLDQAKRLLDATLRGFQLGQSNIAALLEAQRTYRSVHADHIDALVLRAQAGAQFERATGAVPTSLLPALPHKEDQ